MEIRFEEIYEDYEILKLFNQEGFYKYTYPQTIANSSKFYYKSLKMLLNYYESLKPFDNSKNSIFMENVERFDYLAEVLSKSFNILTFSRLKTVKLGFSYKKYHTTDFDERLYKGFLEHEVGYAKEVIKEISCIFKKNHIKVVVLSCDRSFIERALVFAAKDNNIPIVVFQHGIFATGDATMSEIDEAVRTIEKTGNKDLVLMQCITNYPSKIDSANVNVLKTYQSAFGCLTGYSDHSPGHVVALASTVIGGRVIEKHFTLNKNDKGPDHPHSMEPNEFKFMVDSIREVERAMGSSRKEVVAEEGETVFVQRRCLYAKRDLVAGQTLTADDITVLRPALGIPPKFKNTIIGKNINKNIPAGDPIFWEDL